MTSDVGHAMDRCRACGQLIGDPAFLSELERVLRAECLGCFLRRIQPLKAQYDRGGFDFLKESRRTITQWVQWANMYVAKFHYDRTR